MRKAGGPRRPPEQSWRNPAIGVNAQGSKSLTPSRRASEPLRGHGCSCRARRSRPTLRLQMQGRWSAASRRGTKSAGHSLLMPCPEVSGPPSDCKVARQVVRGVPTRNKDRQVTRCSCRFARWSRPTLRLQIARRWSAASRRGTKVGRSLVAHAASGGHGPPSDGNAQRQVVRGVPTRN